MVSCGLVAARGRNVPDRSGLQGKQIGETQLSKSDHPGFVGTWHMATSLNASS